MEDSFILSHVDHTLLKATASWAEIKKLCDEAVKFKTASVCIPPSYVEAVHKVYDNRLSICTVIGFPLGYVPRHIKESEVAEALLDGAAEFDVVVNLGDVKNGEFDKITAEITALKKISGDDILKIIVETCCLTKDEKIKLCKCVTDGGADFIKTSTGFGSAGAVMEDIELFKDHIGSDVRIKAAGGIRTREDMEAFLNAGCARLGTSSAIKILAGENAAVY